MPVLTMPGETASRYDDRHYRPLSGQKARPMLLTPVDRPWQWRNPPRLALALAVLMTLLFVLWHPADQQRRDELTQQYRQTLDATEWPLYETHALRTGQRAEFERLRAARANGDYSSIAMYVGADDSFVQAMLATGQDYLMPEQYDAWKRAREAFDERRSKFADQALGIDPEAFRPITFVTFNLVQPDAWQLLSVLLVLLTAGIALEMALGSGAVLAALLGGGSVGALAFLLLNGPSILPLAGAGAGCAALVGMYAMQFRNGPVHYLGRPGNALLLLPLWLAVVALNVLLTPLRLPEIAAQVAGLVSGPVWYLVHQRWFTHAQEEIIEVAPVVEPTDEDLAYRRALNRALESVAQLEFPAAQRQLRELIKSYPQEVRTLVQLYHLEKLTPGSPAFEAVARRLFAVPNPEHDHIVLTLYRDYMRVSPEKVALDTETCLRLAMRFTRMGEVMEADKVMKMILERKAKHSLLAKTAQALADAMDRLQEPAKARFYRQVAEQHAGTA